MAGRNLKMPPICFSLWEMRAANPYREHPLSCPGQPDLGQFCMVGAPTVGNFEFSSKLGDWNKLKATIGNVICINCIWPPGIFTYSELLIHELHIFFHEGHPFYFKFQRLSIQYVCGNDTVHLQFLQNPKSSSRDWSAAESDTWTKVSKVPVGAEGKLLIR